MRKKITVDQLKVGMYLDGLDASWFKTPFFKHHFLIKSEEQIEKIKDSKMSYVYIDTEKGLDVGGEKTSVKVESKAEPMKITSEALKKETSSETADGEKLVDDEMFEIYTKKKEDLLNIDRDIILKGSYVDFSIFIKLGMDISPLVEYKGKVVEITEEALSNQGELLIDREDTVKFKAYLKDAMKAGVQGLSKQQVKNIMVKENAKILVKELLSNPENSEKMEECKGMVEDVIGAIIDSKGFITNLLTLNKHDYYTYTHCVNVSVYSVATAIALGGSSEKELFNLGMGSLLHDIGKNTIPPEILNKPENRLTDFELKILAEHVIEGYNILKLYKTIPNDAFYPVLEHHEKISGNGYPKHLWGADMHLAGKISSLTNFYDKLTTSRPNSRVLSPFEALSLIRNSAQDFDMKILKEFIKILGKSP